MQKKHVTVKKQALSRIDILKEKTGCSVFQAQIALNKRRNDVEFAAEYLRGLRLSPSEGDLKRFPKWMALIEDERNGLQS